jgi:pimeloyl-ACP methyl ester carboxylesterase
VLLFALPAAVVATAVVATFGEPLTDVAPRAARAPHGMRATWTRWWRIDYRAHDGRLTAGYVLLPSWYGPHRDPPLPLVLSPHGRGVGGRANARLWGGLPGRDGLAVVSPDGQGRRLPRYSWGYSGQIADLARLPGLVRKELPWLRVEPHRVYAVAGSMGGQEVLLLLARYPRLLRGAAVIDAPTDLALQYRDFTSLPCNRSCFAHWKEPLGLGLQRLARVEVGGTPEQDPAAYAARSPDHYVAAIARSGVPLALWWSVRDRLVQHPELQEAEFVRALRRAHPRAALRATVGTWSHQHGIRLNLPRALAWLHLGGARR